MVTGAAGFIGSNFVQYWVEQHPNDGIVALDALTYAGNMASLEPVMKHERFKFMKGDIRDGDMMRDIIHERFATGLWNIYGAQASDGDNWENDSPHCRELLGSAILPYVQHFAYIEITPGEPQNLWREYDKLGGHYPNFAMQRIESYADIYPVFRELFKKNLV